MRLFSAKRNKKNSKLHDEHRTDRKSRKKLMQPSVNVDDISESINSSLFDGESLCDGQPACTSSTSQGRGILRVRENSFSIRKKSKTPHDGVAWKKNSDNNKKLGRGVSFADGPETVPESGMSDTVETSDQSVSSDENRTTNSSNHEADSNILLKRKPQPPRVGRFALARQPHYHRVEESVTVMHVLFLISSLSTKILEVSVHETVKGFFRIARHRHVARTLGDEKKLKAMTPPFWASPSAQLFYVAIFLSTFLEFQWQFYGALTFIFLQIAWIALKWVLFFSDDSRANIAARKFNRWLKQNTTDEKIALEAVAMLHFVRHREAVGEGLMFVLRELSNIAHFGLLREIDRRGYDITLMHHDHIPIEKPLTTMEMAWRLIIFQNKGVDALRTSKTEKDLPLNLHQRPT